MSMLVGPEMASLNTLKKQGVLPLIWHFCAIGAQRDIIDLGFLEGRRHIVTT